MNERLEESQIEKNKEYRRLRSEGYFLRRREKGMG
jgi:hypothetical protein